jgi:hypothetical protein
VVVDGDVLAYVLGWWHLKHGAEVAVRRELPLLPEPFSCAGVDGAIDSLGRPQESPLGYGYDEQQGQIDESNGGDVYLMKPARADDKLER